MITKPCKFSENQIKSIHVYYNKGHTLQDCAKAVGCSRTTISNSFKKYGLEFKHGDHNHKYNIPMVMHDWNGNKSISTITDTYDFPSEECAYQLIKKWRNNGWKFNRRDRVMK